MIKSTGWTYGCEHEFADWPRERELPDGFSSDPEKTIVNSNGIAWARDWPFGGEINTPPNRSPEKQCVFLGEILKRYPECRVNYRCNLHVHVRIPGLSKDLEQLKVLAGFNRFWLPHVLPLVEPIPEPNRLDYSLKEGVYAGARKRYNRRKVSHHTVLSEERTMAQLHAKTLTEFFEAEVPRTKRTNRPMWYAQARAAVNIRQLLQTDTIEFRHFPGTLDAEELLTAVEWCEQYLLCAFNAEDPEVRFVLDYASRPWPIFEPYDHWLEERWLLTNPEKNKDKEDRDAWRFQLKEDTNPMSR